MDIVLPNEDLEKMTDGELIITRIALERLSRFADDACERIKNILSCRAEFGGVRKMEKRKILVKSEAHQAPLIVEVARLEEEWERGLMFRRSLGENEGMLFVFPDDDDTGFWMKDTYIPLTIAYIDKDGYIFELQDLEPLAEVSQSPTQPYRHALEVNHGWFRCRNLGVGAYIERLP